MAIVLTDFVNVREVKLSTITVFPLYLGTAEAPASLKVSKVGGNFATAATQTTAAAAITGGDATLMYALTFAAADLDTLGSLVLEYKGATSTSYHTFRVVSELCGGLKVGAIVAGTFGASAIDATAIADGAIDAATFATDAISAAAVSTAAASKIGNTTSQMNSVLYYRVKRNESVAAKRTLYFAAAGTLPSYAQISTDGGTFGASTNAPGTVSGNFRKLVLAKAELTTIGRKVVQVTTTSTVNVVTMIVDVVGFDPLKDGSRSGQARIYGASQA